MRENSKFFQLLSLAVFASLMLPAAASATEARAAEAHAAAKAPAKPKVLCSNFEVRFFTSANWCPSCRRVNDQLASYFRSLRSSNGPSACGYEHEIIIENGGHLTAVKVNKVDVSFLQRDDMKKAGMSGKYLPEIQLRKVSESAAKDDDNSKLIDYKSGEYSLAQIKSFVEKTAKKSDEDDRQSKSVARN